MSNKYPIVRVAINSPLRRAFDYLSKSLPSPGTRVAVSFGHQKSVMGVVIDTPQHSETPTNKLKPIQGILDEQPALDNELLSLCQWCSDYYHFPLGEVCHLALPALLRKPDTEPEPEIEQQWEITHEGASSELETLSRAPKQQEALAHFQRLKKIPKEQLGQENIATAAVKALEAKGLVELINRPNKAFDCAAIENLTKQAPLALNDEQQSAFGQIEFDQFNTYLLEGVTGSGKTEIYLQAIEKVLQKNKQVLVLVPEIGLTPQTFSRFENRFNVPVAVLHSGITDKQRLNIWQKARSGRLPIIIGTRSSIFTQLPNLGLIIVDEEHDLSYKQQEGVRYSARDIAIVRANKKNIPLILGSATPSLESLHNALTNRYKLLRLQQRAQQTALPEISLINGTENTLEDQTLKAISNTLDAGQQVLLFINRRGFAPTLMCQDCHWISLCTHCDSRMTYHRRGAYAQLHCHHCDQQASVPKQCPHCHSRRLEPLGTGTQRSQQSLEQLFPSAPVIRIDRDSMSRKGQLETALKTVSEGQPCILVGTQMLAKGHHFANLGLAVLLGIDNSFFSSDFRGPERMGQLLTQVAGRVGREQHHSQVIIQTQFEDHPLLQQLVNEGYRPFAEQLLAERQLTGMPPFEHITLVRCHAQNPQLAHQFLQQARNILERIANPYSGLQYLGPFPANMEKRNNRFHALLQIKAVNRIERQKITQQLCVELEKAKQPTGLHWLIDVDGQEF